MYVGFSNYCFSLINNSNEFMFKKKKKKANVNI